MTIQAPLAVTLKIFGYGKGWIEVWMQCVLAAVSRSVPFAEESTNGRTTARNQICSMLSRTVAVVWSGRRPQVALNDTKRSSRLAKYEV